MANMWISQRIREPGSISLPASAAKTSPTLPTAHSMNSPALRLHVVRLVREAGDALLALLQRRQHVMDDAAAVRIRRLDLDRAHPARLGEAGLGDGTEPLVLRPRGAACTAAT